MADKHEGPEVKTTYSCFGFSFATLVDLPLMDDKVEIPLKSNVRLKQENDDLYNFVQV